MKKYFFVPVLVLALSIFFGCKTDPGEPIPTPAHPTFSVILDSNNGSNETQVQTGEYGSTITLNQNTFVYPGHTFIGWSTRDNPEIRSAVFYGDKDTFKIVGNQTLYARWKAHDCKIEFNFNDAGQNLGADMSEITFCSDGEITLPLSTYALQDMGFRGWTTDPESKDVIYKNGETIPADTFAKSEEGMTTVQLYAVWEAPDYFVTFYANNGTGKSVKQGFFAGEEQNLLSCDFERTDYVLKGWSKTSYPNDDASVNYAPEEKITVTSDMALYAVWTKQMTKLKFVANGGEGSMSDQSFFYSSGITIKTNAFTRDHYNFKGWNTKADGSGTPYAAGAKITLASIQDEVTLYAQWEIKKFTLSYDINKPSYESSSYMKGTTASAVVEYGQTAVVSSPNYTVDHYTFNGWNTKANGSGKSYSAGSKIVLTEDVGNVTLYAQWTPKTYTITYHSNQNQYYDSNLSKSVLKDTVIGTQSYKYGESIRIDYITTFSDYYKKRSNGKEVYEEVVYKFNGWSKTATSRTIEQKGDNTITNCTLENIDLYAVYSYKDGPCYVFYENLPSSYSSKSSKYSDVCCFFGNNSTGRIGMPSKSYIDREVGDKILIGYRTENYSNAYAEYGLRDTISIKNSSYYDSKTEGYYKPIVLKAVWFDFAKGTNDYGGYDEFYYDYLEPSNKSKVTRVFAMEMGEHEITNKDYYMVARESTAYSDYNNYPNRPKVFTNAQAFYFVDKLNYDAGLSLQYFISDQGNANGYIENKYIPEDPTDERWIVNIGKSWYTELSSTKKLYCARQTGSFRIPDAYEWLYAANGLESNYKYERYSSSAAKYAGFSYVKGTFNTNGVSNVGMNGTTLNGLQDMCGNLREVVHYTGFYDIRTYYLNDTTSNRLYGTVVCSSATSYNTFMTKAYGGAYNSKADACKTNYDDYTTVSGAKSSSSSTLGLRIMRQKSWSSYGVD